MVRANLIGRLHKTGRKLSTACKLQSDQYVACVRQPGLPLDFFQSSLPRLPVGDLEAACREKLALMRMFLTEDEWLQSEQAMHRFVNGAGVQLHNRLVAKAEQFHLDGVQKNHLSDAYSGLEHRYRSSLLVKNAVIPLTADCLSEKDALVNLSNTVTSFLRLMRSVDDNVLPPTVRFARKRQDASKENSANSRVPTHFSRTAVYADMCEQLRNGDRANAYAMVQRLGGVPRCVNQIQRIFRSTRVPQVGLDERVLLGKNAGVRHICVVLGGRIWKVRVLDEAGRVCRPIDIWNALATIQQRCATPRCSRSAEVQLALCTAVNRDLWATLRRSMLSNATNRQAFNTIESSLFAVAMDHESTSSDMQQQARMLLLGDYANRYLDKDFQVISVGNQLGVYVDESWSNGEQLHRAIGDVVDDLRSRRPPPNQSSNDFLTDANVSAPRPNVADGDVEEVRFTLNRDQLNLYDMARSQYDSLRADCDVHIGTLPLGTRLAKSQALSADFLFQLAIQCAFSALFKRRAPVQLESCSLDTFVDGRVDDMLTTSPLTRHLVSLIMHGDSADVHSFDHLILAASRAHRDRIVRTSQGKTSNFYLDALSYEADLIRDGDTSVSAQAFTEDDCAFLSCPALSRYNQFDIITAQASGPGVFDMSVFGRWQPGSIRVTYCINDEVAHFSCLVMQNEVAASASQFAAALRNATTRIGRLLTRRAC